ncbi:sulfurtransferase [Rheinheimera muenzenbergensis]|uniref:Sulfurtransferase n=1 Tax=Rheinheimera muenzenbergensis TaxID=1193628 RepID=A0ABU8C3K4_9GAMM
MSYPLVTTDWLETNLNLEQLILVDASMSKVVGKKAIEYEMPLYIPNSRRLDLERSLCDPNSSQTHAFPTEEQFTAVAQRLGINSESIVVFYDNQGIYSAPRAWWIFQVMGFKNVFVLDGGLPQWLLENRRVVPNTSNIETEVGNINGIFNPQLICDSNFIFEQMNNKQLAVLDARSRDRFLGIAPEPRDGVRSGHIPNSISLPYSEVLDGHCFKIDEQLAAIFSARLDSKTSTLVFTCGSGITACIILLSAVIAGYRDLILYDGSWSDWGSNIALPVGN